MSGLETTDLSCNRARKSSLFMAEEFALQKSHRNRGAVQLYEGSISTFTASMNGARDDFLARSCFALDENCGVRGRHRANQVQRFHQSCAAADDSFKCLQFR